MPIRWDSLLARHVAQELHGMLAASRLRALRLHAPSRDLALLFRDRTLLWRLHPLRGYVIVRGPVEPDDTDVRLPARVKRVYAPPDERIIRFELLRERGGRPGLDLVVELLGNQWNALVTEGPDGIIRHVLWTRDRGRRQIVGRAYVPPRPSSRVGVAGDLTAHDWRALLADVPQAERERTLVRHVAWTSPLNAGALTAAGGRAPGRGPAETDAHQAAGGAGAGAAEPEPAPPDALAEGHALWARMAAPDARPEPVGLESQAGLQPYPFVLPDLGHRPAASLLVAFEACAAAEAERSGAVTDGLLVGPSVSSRLEEGVEQAARKVARLSAALAEAERDDPAALRSAADLILARYAEIPPGASRVVLADFGGGERLLELDPSAPPHENAGRLYGRAAKVERARATLPALLAEAEAEHEQLRALLQRAWDGTAGADEIRAALPAGSGPGAPEPADGPRPYHVFTSSGGLEIRVGRGARHNDELTFHHSAPGDVWLHARQAPGAHVILRWPGPGGPPARDLEEAATLAALHSKARTSALVPVDWTLRKHVRKPRGAGPGTVVPARVRTLFVRPDPALADSLEER
jgi:predicted ribosome quality control (RQC) complex YloA/Tae2 family protein